MAAEWYSQYLDGQPGAPVELVKTPTEMTWRVTLPDLAMVLILHGTKDYLGCSIKRVYETTTR